MSGELLLGVWSSMSWLLRHGRRSRDIGSGSRNALLMRVASRRLQMVVRLSSLFPGLVDVEVIKSYG